MLRLAYIAGEHDDKYGWRSNVMTTVTKTTTDLNFTLPTQLLQL